MRLFGSPRGVKPREFNYIPQYYDERKERLEDLLKEADPNDEESTKAMKARIKMGFSSRPYYYDKLNTASKVRRKSNIRTLIIVLILLVVVVVYLSNNFESIQGLTQ